MKIRDMAQKYDVSQQAIYKRLGSQGIDPKSLQAKNGHLTAEGREIIDEMYSDTKAAENDRIISLYITENDGLKSKVEELKTENNELKNSCQLLTTEKQQLEKQVENLLSERDFLRSALEHEQALHGMTLQKLSLPAPEDSTGFMTRLKRLFKRGNDNADSGK